MDVQNTKSKSQKYKKQISKIQKSKSQKYKMKSRGNEKKQNKNGEMQKWRN
jgi:hypothetical protein